MGEMGGRRGIEAALSPPGVGAGEVVGQGRAPVATPVGGTGGRRPREGLGRRLANWARWAGLACEQGPPGPVREGGLFLFFSLFFFSVLFHFKILRHFLKKCFLHNNYQCNIWHPPNIFVLTFENFGVCHYLEFKFWNGFESL